MNYDDRIVKYIDRTQKVVLRCKEHPNLRWTTKNISGIGARTIFYDWDSGDPECHCSISLLEPLGAQEALEYYMLNGATYWGLTEEETTAMASGRNVYIGDEDDANGPISLSGN